MMAGCAAPLALVRFLCLPTALPWATLLARLRRWGRFQVEIFVVSQELVSGAR